MRKIKLIKKMIAFTLALIMCCGTGSSVKAAESEPSLPDGWRRLGLTDEQMEQLDNEIQPREPASGLSSIAITDLAINEKNEIHIEVKIIGTAKGVLCWCDRSLCDENVTESVNIVSGNRVIGEEPGKCDKAGNVCTVQLCGQIRCGNRKYIRFFPYL